MRRRRGSMARTWKESDGEKEDSGERWRLAEAGVGRVRSLVLPRLALSGPPREIRGMRRRRGREDDAPSVGQEDGLTSAWNLSRIGGRKP